MAKPAHVDMRINGNSSNFERLKWTRDNDVLIREHNTQADVDDELVEHIVAAVDEQYIDELKKDYVGYADETAKSLLAHVKTT